MDAKEVAGEAGAIIAEIAKFEPWVSKIIPIIAPQAAGVVPLIDAFAPIILATAARALGDIANGNNGDLLSAMIELFQHLDKNQPNSSVLSGGESKTVNDAAG